MALLEIQNLSVYFPVTKGVFHRTIGHFKAVEDVSFTVESGGALSIIGESGSGKTTIGNVILGIHSPTKGEVRYGSKPVSETRFTGAIQAVFQNPYSSLDPRMNVLDIVTEPLRYSASRPGKQKLAEKAAESLESVGIDPGAMYRYPHEFSGGQRQRISIARALISSPELIVLDEPASSLDVSVRAQILNLLSDIRVKRNLSYVYISHDLATVRFLSRNVIILYGGRIMESGRTEKIFANPVHPYTKLLLRSARDIVVEGSAGDAAESAEGCPFRYRCPAAEERCAGEFPRRTEVEEGHYVYCYQA